jgi:hypothetical protein
MDRWSPCSQLPKIEDWGGEGEGQGEIHKLGKRIEKMLEQIVF